MKKIIYWFRNDLRLHDQPVLKKFEIREDVQFLPIFCINEQWFVKQKLEFPNMGSIRAWFLIQTVNNLKHNLQNIRSDLLITFSKTDEILSSVAK